MADGEPKIEISPPIPLPLFDVEGEGGGGQNKDPLGPLPLIPSHDEEGMFTGYAKCLKKILTFKSE
jgi:hypothetical protein